MICFILFSTPVFSFSALYFLGTADFPSSFDLFFPVSIETPLFLLLLLIILFLLIIIIIYYIVFLYFLLMIILLLLLMFLVINITSSVNINGSC